MREGQIIIADISLVWISGPMLPLLPLVLVLEVVDQPVLHPALLHVLLLLGELGMEQPSFTWDPSVTMDQ